MPAIKNSPAVHILFIVLLGFMAYSNTFDAAFIFDDDANIADNPLIKDFSSFFSEPSEAEVGPRMYRFFKSRTLGCFSFALNYRAHGLDVRGYHAANLAIHIINALLVYWLVTLSFRTPALKASSLSDRSRHIALLSALLFVSHPIQTQAVTYIVQRFASLAAAFYLLSLALYIKCRLSDTLSFKSITLYVLSLLSAVLAMKTKEIAFTLPLVILLYELMFLREPLRKRALYLVPILLTMLIIPISLIGVDMSSEDVMGEFQEATRLKTGMPRADYFFTQLRVITTYIRLLFLPINQNLDYDYPAFDSLFGPQVFLSLVFLLSILGIGIFLTCSSKRRDAALRLAAFGIFWFFITISVESSIIPIVDVIFEHRVYLPGAGIFTAAATGAFVAFDKLNNKKSRSAGIALLASVVLVLSAATCTRNAIWRSNISMWQDVVRKAPGNSRGHYNLANTYMKQGRVEEAIRHYEKTISLSPKDTTAHNDLGYAYYKNMQADNAIEQYEIAIELNPDYSLAYNNLGAVYEARGLIDKRIEAYRAALRIDPEFVLAHINIGRAYLDKGQLDKAMYHLDAAIKLKPYNAQAHSAISKVYEKKGLTEMAEKHRRLAEGDR
jgi:tetratricopeptide (TPR) repeat protein